MGAKKFGTSKSVKDIIALAKAQGFEVRITGGNHIQFIPPDKDLPAIVTSLTSSDNRQILNLKSRLKKVGLEMKSK